MPGFDMTGPWGEGPRTGRGAGRCAGTSESRRPYWGLGRRGAGRGFGRPRRGRGRFYLPYGIQSMGPIENPSNVDDETYLKELEGALEAELEEVRNRLKNMPE
ncbi:MAG: DUF5320 domain-containing protein [Euryarchaeota archaeon]|nr:DUF5320 domain-containing protein [Euryarchaeota archaeon]